MQNIIHTLSNLNIWSIIFRLFLATVCGGIIGLERSKKRRPAGMRTHMLVCIASSLVMLIGEYMVNIYAFTDPSRIGAQVISGIGFLGVGTIIVTGKNQVRGLTTAAGIWASACVGLAIGAGFYLGALVAFAFIFFAVSILHKLDSTLVSKSKLIELIIQFDSDEHTGAFLSSLSENGFKITEIEIQKSPGLNTLNLTLKSKKPFDHVLYVSSLWRFEGLVSVEEV